MSNPFKKLLGQTAIYGLSSIIGRLLNYLLVPLYTVLFLPEEYGIVTELYAYLVFLLVLLTYGMETAFFRFSEQTYSVKQVFSNSVISLFFTSSLFIGLVFIFNQPLANFLDYQNHPEYIRWFAIIIGVDAFTSIPFAYLRQQNKAVKFATVKLINIGINIGLNLFFLLLCPFLLENYDIHFIEKIYHPSVGIGYIFISNLIASLFTLILLIKEIFSIRLSFDTRLFKKMIRYSSPLIIVGLAGSVNEVLDRVLLKHLLPDSANPMHQIGIYGANYKIAIMMTLFIQTFRYAAEPFFFAQLAEKNPKKIYAQVMTYFVIFGLIIFLGIMLYLDIVKYFIDQSYHSGLHIVPILLLANLFLGIIYNLSVWYKVNNLTRYGAIISLSGAAITLIFNIILIPKLGYTGSAWATFICYFSMMLISFFWGRKIYPVPYHLKKILLYTSITILLFIFTEYFTIQQVTIKYLIHSILFIAFITFVIHKEHLLSLIIRKQK